MMSDTESNGSEGQIRVGEEWYDKWHLKPLGVDEGDRVRFSFKPPRGDSVREKVGTVTYVPGEGSRNEDTYAKVDVDDAGTWVLDRGTVQIVQDGRGNRRNGSLINVEGIPKEGDRVLVEGKSEDTPVVGVVESVKLETDRVQIQRSFDATSYWAGFDEIVTEVR